MRPVGCGLEIRRALVSSRHVGGLCNMHRIREQGWRGGFRVTDEKGQFVNADILPECCVREKELENFSSSYF